MKVKTALSRALRSVILEDRDQAAVELARHYAVLIDDGQAVRAGPKLLEVLIELGMTPKARASVVRGGVASGRSGSALDELRSRREHRAASVHETPA